MEFEQRSEGVGTGLSLRGVIANGDQTEQAFDQVRADEPFMSAGVAVREPSIAPGADAF